MFKYCLINQRGLPYQLILTLLLVVMAISFSILLVLVWQLPIFSL